MQVRSFGIRIHNTDRLLWRPDHICAFKPWPEAARRFTTQAEAVAVMEQIITKNQRLNEQWSHLCKRPTDLEVVEITTSVVISVIR
jgi:hypothetical protein